LLTFRLALGLWARTELSSGNMRRSLASGPKSKQQTMLAALELLWQEGYLLLDKWVDGHGWTDRSRYANIDTFVGCGGFRLRLTPKGQELFAEMESQVEPEQPIKSRDIGFHASL